MENTNENKFGTNETNDTNDLNVEENTNGVESNASDFNVNDHKIETNDNGINVNNNSVNASNNGVNVNDNRVNTNEYNVDTNNYNHSVAEADSKYHLTLLTSYFLGGFGVHRFVNGKVGTGLLMLFTCGGCGIWAFIDFITILAGSFRNIEGDFIRSSKPFFKTWSNILVIVFIVAGILFNIFYLKAILDFYSDSYYYY